MPEKNKYTFSDLLEVSEQYDFFSENDKVKSMLNNFPPSTTFIGLIKQDLNKIICLEGHHRAVAVALARKNGKQIDFKGSAKIALSFLGRDEISILDRVLKRGTSKNPEKDRRNQ